MTVAGTSLSVPYACCKSPFGIVERCRLTGLGTASNINRRKRTSISGGNDMQAVASVQGERLVSIGMPVYNGEETIAVALDSLLAQTYRNFELHISDNCSTDNTGEICERYLGLDPRISYTRNERNV